MFAVHDWRTVPPEVVASAIDTEAEHWRTEFSWNVRDAWQSIEPARLAGRLPGFVAMDGPRHVLGWTCFLVHQRALQVAVLAARSAEVTRALVGAIVASKEAAEATLHAVCVRDAAPGLRGALARNGFDVVLYRYLSAPAVHLRTVEQGRGTTDDGPGTTDDGPRRSDHGPGAPDQAPGATDAGRRTTDDKPRTPDDGRRTTDAGPRTTDDGPRTTDAGPRTTDEIFRLWQPSDLERTVTLCTRAYSDPCAVRAFAPLGTPDEWRDYVTGLVAGPGCGRFVPSASLIAERDASRPVDAALIATDLGEGTAHIAQVAVDPDAQGRGLGRGLVRQAMSAFADAGFRRVTLIVSAANTRASGLYRRLGFRDRASFVVAVNRQPRRSTSVALATGGVSTRR